MPDNGETRVVKTDCALCVHSCGLDVLVKGDKVVGVRGMTEHPISKGYLCPRGEAMLEYIYAPERLRYPLLRRGDGFERVTWDEALDVTAERMLEMRERFGARSLAVWCGSVGVENIELSAFAQRFRGAWGTPNFLSVESFCYHALITARLFTFGRFLMEQPEHSKYIILWGHNPHQSFPTRVRRIEQALADGAGITVIDPRRTPFADSGRYLRPRPETDCALALAVIHVLIGEGLYDRQFVQDWTIGFDQLADHVREYGPEWAEPITGIGADDIRALARDYAGAPSACIIQGTCSFDQQENGMQTMRAFSIMQAITGNVNRQGSWVRVPFLRLSDLRMPMSEPPIGVDEYPLFYDIWGRQYPYGHALALPKAVLDDDPYPIRGMVVTGGNPAVTFPNSRQFERVLDRLDLLVVMDVFMTETARRADVVLPAATFLEKAGIAFTYAVDQGVPYVMLRKPALSYGEAWPEWRFWTELGRRLGLDQYFPWQSADEVISYLLEPSGITVKQLMEQPEGMFYDQITYGVSGRLFGTPSGKIELYSETLAQHGHDPLPRYRPSSISVERDPDGEFPLVLLVGNREIEYTHSQLRMLPSLRARVPGPTAAMHPDTGRRYGVEDGTPVKVRTRYGEIEVTARWDPGMGQDLVAVPKGWAGARCNELVGTDLRDPIMGYPVMKNVRCRIAPAGGGDAGEAG